MKEHIILKNNGSKAITGIDTDLNYKIFFHMIMIIFMGKIKEKHND